MLHIQVSPSVALPSQEEDKERSQGCQHSMSSAEETWVMGCTSQDIEFPLPTASRVPLKMSPESPDL